MRIALLCLVLSVSACTCTFKLDGTTQHVIKVQQPDGGAADVQDLIENLRGSAADAGPGTGGLGTAGAYL